MDIQNILKLHARYLAGEDDGMRADLRDADLRGADLRGANLGGADLGYADLRDANLRGADLRDADLEDVGYNEYTSFFALQCPESGSFTAYKKVVSEGGAPLIATLRIPARAHRSSATSRKCRASEARVVRIETLDGDLVQTAISKQDSRFIYRAGEMVKSDGWDADRWNECSQGIHFFITKQEAINY